MGTKSLVGESAELLKPARTAVREADPWARPNGSQASQRWGAEASGWAQHSLSWEAAVSKGNPRSLGAALTGEEKWLQSGRRWGTQHRCLPGSPSLALLCCRRERQKPCVRWDRSGASRAHSAVRFCAKPLSGKICPDIQQ